MYATVEKIQKKKTKKSGMNLGIPFQLLFIHVGLQMLNDPKQSVDILEVGNSPQYMSHQHF